MTAKDKRRRRNTHSALKRAKNNLFSGIGVPEQSGSFEADDFQLQAIESLNSGFDTLVVAPTGAGKTFIAIEAITHCLKNQGRAIYTTPLKALSNTKYSDFKKRFEPEYGVGLLTGDRKIDSDASVVVATTEIYRNDLYSMRADYSIVVLDEFHFLADTQRGPVWEEAVILSPKESVLLMLSASISNAEEIADWIELTRGTKVNIVRKEVRPVELRYGFLTQSKGIVPLADEKGNIFKEVNDYYNYVSPRGKKAEGRGKSRRGRKGGRGRK